MSEHSVAEAPRSRTPRPVARFDDRQAGTSVRFTHLDGEIVAREPGEVRGALDAVQRAVDGGAWAFGMVAYEAAAGLDPVAVARSPQGPGGTPPLVWFGISSRPGAEASAAGAPERSRGGEGAGAYRVGPWQPEWTEREFADRVDAVRAAIAEGLTYQVNLTTRLRGRIDGDLLACYLDLVGAQQGAHSAYLDLGRFSVLSASPELFWHRRGDRIETRPMKGTARRAADPAADDAARRALLASEKERAENVMIVDLLRNDLARLAHPGSISVPRLLDAEPYPTVWQLTSTIGAVARPAIGLADTFGALFPCGSITGAPKLSTIRLIAELETSPRGAYCGAIGLMRPATATAPAESRFSVAIRTIVVDRADRSAVYGVGGGITWGSTAVAEAAELEAKAAVLGRLADAAAPSALRP